VVLLSPFRPYQRGFEEVVDDPFRHQKLLADAQRLRGRIYAKDGALDERSLTRDGRHVQPSDDESWHLLTIGSDDRVQTCLRYHAHVSGVELGDLNVHRSLCHHSAALATRVKRAVQAEVTKAKGLGFSCVELGAWAISEELRCSTEAIRMLLMMYSLSQMLGGAIAFSTATRRHHSSSILRRIGGMPLVDGQTDIGPYFDSQYDCEMELLSFDSRFPNPRYIDSIREFRTLLTQVPVIWSSATDVSSRLSTFHHLHSARPTTICAAASAA
jgi:hypothetical protein